MRIVIAGTTGLVGGATLYNLRFLPNVAVTSLSRRPINDAGVDIRQFVGPVQDWPDMLKSEAFDVAICALGTTIKTAGSKDAFTAVDRDAVVAFARASRRSGARQFILVSSVGADAGSGNFYLSTKGKAERDIQAIGFERFDVVRPGLLIGHRQGPVRWGERIAIALSPITNALTPEVLSRYRSTKVSSIASLIAALCGRAGDGIFHYYNEDIRRILSKMD